MKQLSVLLLLFTALTANAAVTANDDSCDIATLPAATLLLPYFEVDLEGTPGDGRTTLFTVVNVTREPQIARVTLWTDLSVPVVSFNLFLTGYDVQAINVYDLLVRGLIAPPNGTSSETTPGSRSASNVTGNPRFTEQAASNCRRGINPQTIPAAALEALRAAFTTGNVPLLCPTGPIGTAHTAAIGYATIDLVADCSLTMPDEASYFDQLLYDNVLTGDYQHISGSGNFASGNPLVHLRAVPEGGAAGSRIDTALPWTFYSGRGTNGHDRRQPLPSVFAARVIDGGATGFETQLQVWRERTSTCGNAAADGTIAFQQFDERENPNVRQLANVVPSASLIDVHSFGSDVGGWMYINAGANGSRPQQMWVSSTMSAEGRYSASSDVVALGNGCSPATPESATIQPRANQNPRANNLAGSPGNTNNDDSCDVGLYPAATLLLPYFEVAVNAPASVARTTLFTVTNVTPQPQIAHVTLFSDWGYPLLTFNIFLTGFDVQAINLYDILVRGIVAPDQGTSNETPPGSISAPNIGGNPNHLPNAATLCNATGQGRGRLPEILRQNVIAALTAGIFPLSCGNNIDIGGQHEAAVGYLTIDVAATCSTAFPNDREYFADEILYDNVLIGDYQIIDPNAATGNYAQGSPLVHIRATQEGGAAGELLETNLASTFYGNYQSQLTPRRDRRQPLPSTFAARFIEGGFSGMQTEYTIWREPRTGSGVTCSDFARNESISIAELVRFDERENPFANVPCNFLCPPLIIGSPVTSSINATDDIFPDNTSGDLGGWIYFNLADTAAGRTNKQAWVTTRMSAQGRFSVMSDATALGNGCSTAAPVPAVIQPAP
jgi:hypothetical protein